MSTMPDAFPTLRVGEIEARGIDWTLALTAGDGVVTSAWASAPAGLTLSSATVAGAMTQTRVTGGVAGTLYELRNTVTTTSGLTMIEAVRIYVIA